MAAEFRQWREENRTYLKDVIPLDTPYNIMIETSSFCNAKCVYCAHSSKNHGVFEGNMTMDLFKKIIDEIKKFPHKPKLVEMYMFGEPLCNPKFEEMLSLASKEQIAERLNFTTNGLLFTKERIDKILSTDIDTIRISLQGLNAEMYKKMCGVTVNFDKFIGNLTYLYEHRGKCKIRLKIADIALKGIPDGRKKFEEMFGGIADSIFVEHIIPIYSAVDYNNIDESIQENVMNGRENIEQKKINVVCHRPFYRLRIGANGDVTAACCDTSRDIYYGNINKTGLVQIWNGGANICSQNAIGKEKISAPCLQRLRIAERYYERAGFIRSVGG